jgi:hypothetical protein
MGNVAVNKILPAIDLLLVLVVVLFSTAGFVHSMEGPDDELTKEYEHIQKELAEKEEKARALEKKQQMLKEYSDGSMDYLNGLLEQVNQRQQRIDTAEDRIEKIRTQFEKITAQFQDTIREQSLRNRIQALRQVLEELEQERKILQNQVSQAVQENAVAKDLKQKLEDIEKEIEKLKTLIKELEMKIQETLEDEWSGPFPQFKGSYILLECDAEGVTVYPGRKCIANDDLDRQTEWLRSKIKRVGAAALVVRPSGFEESYSRFYAVLTKLAGQEEAKGNTIVLSFWPIEEDESIDKYKSKEN